MPMTELARKFVLSGMAPLAIIAEQVVEPLLDPPEELLLPELLPLELLVLPELLPLLLPLEPLLLPLLLPELLPLLLPELLPELLPASSPEPPLELPLEPLLPPSPNPESVVLAAHPCTPPRRAPNAATGRSDNKRERNMGDPFLCVQRSGGCPPASFHRRSRPPGMAQQTP
jgi:hypothetical protein